jgi:hypothetical protein
MPAIDHPPKFMEFTSEMESALLALPRWIGPLIGDPPTEESLDGLRRFETVKADDGHEHREV